MDFKDEVKQAAQGGWSRILLSLSSVGVDALDGRQQPCPLCQGTDRFRVFDDFDQTGGMFCNKCFNKKNGDGFASLCWLNGWSFRECLERVGEHLGVKKKETGRPKDKDPAEQLEWMDWNDFLAGEWAAKMPGLTVEAALKNGARMARYNARYTVICLPMLNAKCETIGWMMWNVFPFAEADPTAGMLPVGRGDSLAWVKMKTTTGSKMGLIGSDGMSRVQAATTVWKTEGPGDMLALWGIIPLELRDMHVVVCNAAGTSETPQQWMLDLWAGKTVNIVHDADIPGQVGSEEARKKGVKKGAAQWVGLSAHNSTAKNIQLPYEIVPAHGKDVRDWVNEGGTWEQLVALGESSTEGTPIELQVETKEDDPNALAAAFVDESRVDGHLGLRYWHATFYRWDDQCYRIIPTGEIQAIVSGFICDVYQKNTEEHIKNLGPAADRTVRSIKMTTISAVMQLIKSITLIPDVKQQPCWLTGYEGRAPHNFIGLQNGILDIENWMATNGNPTLIPHSPEWFSPVKLPYVFDKDARCDHWMKVISDNLSNEQDRIDLLQQWFGYNLTPDTSQQKFLILEGDGNNGKSVLLAALVATLGPDNCSHIPLELFSQRFALSPTVGKLANVISEVGELDKVAEGQLKSFTSGDRMSFEKKGKDLTSEMPTARLTLAFNNRPRFADRSGGLFRRMLILIMDQKISPKEKIYGMDHPDWWLETKFGPYSDQMPGLLNWALHGLKELRQYKRFTVPASSDAAVAQFQLDNNPARTFLVEHFEACSIGNWYSSKELYKEYSDWCTENGNRRFANGQFGKEVFRAFSNATKHQSRDDAGNREWVYYGINKKSGFNQEEWRNNTNFDDV